VTCQHFRVETRAKCERPAFQDEAQEIDNICLMCDAPICPECDQDDQYNVCCTEEDLPCKDAGEEPGK
jgi:hypothetical protein